MRKGKQICALVRKSSINVNADTGVKKVSTAMTLDVNHAIALMSIAPLVWTTPNIEQK